MFRLTASAWRISGDIRCALWRRPRPSGSCSSMATGSKPASGSRCARRTPARWSHESREPGPRRRVRQSTRPSAQAPLSALLLAEFEHDAGLPPGWLNVLVGPSAEIGDVLVEDERVRLITFTGSSGVGWKLRERAPRKKVNLELGNATPVIVA